MELRMYLKIIWKRLWILILLPVIAGSVAIYYSMKMVPYYTANTTLYVIDTSGNRANEVAYEQVLVGAQLSKDYAELVRSRTVAKAVIKDLGLKGFSADAITWKIGVSQVEDTSVLNISIQDTSPERAKDIANSVAKEFARKAVEIMKADTVNIIDKAEKPLYPSGPPKSRNTILVIFAALFFAGGIIFVLEYLDIKIKTAEDVEKYLGLSAIGTIPKLNLK